MIGLVSATPAGAAVRGRLAAAWPGHTRVYEGGGLQADFARAFAECRELVCFLDPDTARRLLAPLLAGQPDGPGADRGRAGASGAVCVDEARLRAVALPGGPGGSADALARAVADALPGFQPVSASATGGVGIRGLDALGWPVEGAVEEVGRAVLDGRPVALRTTGPWPLPALPPNVAEHPSAAAADGSHTLWVTDQVIPLGPAEAVVRPPSLSVGVGVSRGVSGAEVLELIQLTLDDAGLSAACVAELATVDAKAGEPGLLAAADKLGVPLRTYTAETLSGIAVPNPSDAPRTAVGTPSVAEAAALAASGGHGTHGEGDGEADAVPGGVPVVGTGPEQTAVPGELTVPKTKSEPFDGSPGMATAAVARRRLIAPSGPTATAPHAHGKERRPGSHVHSP